jgi:hypothetical protein
MGGDELEQYHKAEDRDYQEGHVVLTLAWDIRAK